ncbi:MAG: protein kinase [Gemmatimonadales bacterium]|nr:protein kinase [Gemmatimonadales bacterium]
MTHVGTTLGRYRLLDRIGAGGMGEVWRAHDSNLDRDVAVKLLAPGIIGNTDTRERFRREAHALSRLSHPGVATIFDFDIQDGVEFLVMELVTGGTLESVIERGPLPLADVTRFAAAIADALHDAHQRGILHRDLKPGNIVLTAAGQPKILDFGIAMLMGADHGSAKLTQTGMIVGSLPYMAPEQLMGDADSAHTDIYSLGVMLFEMTTGRRPFLKERAEALMFEIFGSAAPSARSLRPDTPDELDRLIASCLTKEPSNRPDSAAAVAAALRAIGGGTPSGTMPIPVRDAIRAIAVLPLRNVSGDPAQEYFADGMTEALITDISRIKALRVTSRTSAMQYKATTKSLPEIARELNVDAVLEGSALLMGNRVRVSVQLISARADETLWADRYDRELKDVLDMQSALAATMAHEIALQLTPAEVAQLTERKTVNAEAHLECLKSRYATYSGTIEGTEIGLRHAKHAIELDPEYAPGWVALADCNLMRAIRGIASVAEAGGAAMEAAQRALALEPDSADALTSLGFVLSYSPTPVKGLRTLQRAVELNPGIGLAQLGLSRLFYMMERFDESIAAAKVSIEVDPLSSLMRTGLGDAYYYAREYSKSEFHYRMGIELDPRFDGAHTDLARTLEAQGRFEEARAEYEVGRRLAGALAGASFGIAHVEAGLGNTVEARRILAELTANRATKVVSAWGIAAVHACLGDVDLAFEWLETAITEHASGLVMLRVHPRLDGIRGDPRYVEMVRRVGLDDASFEA